MQKIRRRLPASTVAVYWKSPSAHLPKAAQSNAGVPCPVFSGREAMSSSSSMDHCPTSVRQGVVRLAMPIIPFNYSMTPCTVARFCGGSSTSSPVVVGRCMLEVQPPSAPGHCRGEMQEFHCPLP